MGVERGRAIPRAGDVGGAGDMRHRVSRRDAMTMRAADRVRRDDAVQFVAGGIVTVMASAVTAREAEESHRGHTGGTEYHAKNVEVHRSRLIKTAVSYRTMMLHRLQVPRNQVPSCLGRTDLKLAKPIGTIPRKWQS